MNSPETCSVVIPTYNRARLLKHTLDSLVAQRLDRSRFEVLVVDDGSSDDTAAVVDAFRDRLTVSYFFQEDLGFRVAKARNLGIAHATGDICVFVDSSVLLHPDCLSAHLATHASSSTPAAVVGYVYGFTLDDSSSDEIVAAVDFNDLGGSVDRLHQAGLLDFREAFYDKYGDHFGDLPAPWVIYWTCNVSARTEQIRAVGGFDEQLQSWGGEDIDLGYRLHQDGARFLLSRQASTIHYPHPKSQGGNMKSSYLNYRTIAEKYDTPITQLLLPLPTINPFNMNDVIRLLQLPSCAEFKASQAGGVFGTP
ncbi:glycosyltransferase [Roseateles amylovorans]|uniref:Glycosyltransferase n=1 Tax=Roseateles amylovorans TaxID=2978473 RepID=A0ABY6AZ00_9BURK|nr:glycosyltransferase [Roseateles amylovorans]UXH76533.1 glycosyltransferase [Roseateles amylovorans]